jgi:energy-coupling factor transporter ATP-binding protein EcfA2
VREEIAFGLENLGVPRQEMRTRVEAMLTQTGLLDLAERSPYALSGGQQQRLAIAAVYVMRPELFVLDEPTSQLDPLGTQEVFAALRNLVSDGRTTVVLASHKVEWLASFADRIVLLADGKVITDDRPQTVLTRPDLQALGVAPTRYTSAARAAKQTGFAPGPGTALPVTLEQAVAYFDGHSG